MRTKSLVIAFAVAAAFAPPLARADACTPGDADAAPRLSELSGFPAGITGHYALPETSTPTMLVVYAHGYRNISDSWVCHLRTAAAKGAVAVATDYAGTGYTGAPGDHRGWFVREGAQEAIASALYFQNAYPSITTTGLLGVSMGGNTSGLAASAQVDRGPGKGIGPVFDYWVSVEGAVNVSETYAAASLVQHAGGEIGAYAAGAVEDIETEIGTTPSEDPAAFAAGLADLSVVTHAPEIASAGLKGVAVVHGLDDGLVPYDQSRELVGLLRGGVPTSMYTVLRRNDWQNPGSAGDEGGTVATGHALSPVMAAAGQRYAAPFAGHGWEGSSSHLVIATGFQVLFDLMDGDVAPANAEYVVDGDLGMQRVA